ncbi:MAG: NAD(+)/NADH kinase [Coriobacteriia bacterium]|nr:NAD(+)/NADH kinase [Coriobacteriia bacterium]
MSVLLVSNITKPEVAVHLQRIQERLDARHVDYQSASGEDLALAAPSSARLAAQIEEFELVCSFGGDGTTLRAARAIGLSGVPLLSFNFGNVGFLSGADQPQMLAALDAALDGRAEVDQRPLAQVDVVFANGLELRQFTLNEVAISRGNFGRIVSLNLYINDILIDNICGDGVLVSTSTGSTAYALSAGGPLIYPGFGGLVTVPISPHSLKAWSIVTAPTDCVSIAPHSNNAQSIVAFLDGEVLECPGGGFCGLEDKPGEPEIASVSVCPGTSPLNLLRYDEYDFYSHISETFFRNKA